MSGLVHGHFNPSDMEPVIKLQYNAPQQSDLCANLKGFTRKQEKLLKYHIDNRNCIDY